MHVTNKLSVLKLHVHCSAFTVLIEFMVQGHFLTHWGRVTQICVFTLQLCKTD